MQNLREKTIRGAAARLAAQLINFIVRIGSLVLLARLLGPNEFGLVGMVTVFIGVLGLFRDFGLSSAAVQHATITDDQTSALFWINTLVGCVLGLLTIGLAPAVAAFYHEPRLFWVTIVSAAGFPLNAVGVQHSAVLQREMRFTALAGINTAALVVGNGLGVAAALLGLGYWALVIVTIAVPLVGTVGVWLASDWVPGAPRKDVHIRSLISFGGALTLTGLVVYIASNAEKILLGRFWGAAALGLYGRAYQLINIPTDNLNSAAGEVAFAALSRLQHEPIRFRRYFLNGYSLVLALTVPITLICALFADDTIEVFLGPKWKDAVPIFRLLAPTVLVFAIVNPLGWLLSSLGLVRRNLTMAVVIAPIMISAYFLGLPYGPKGVALTYSSVMVAWSLPAIAWAVHRTAISFSDVLQTLLWPLLSSIAAAGCGLGVRILSAQLPSPVLRLVLESLSLLAVYVGVLLIIGGQRSFYVDLARGLWRPASHEKARLASA